MKLSGMLTFAGSKTILLLLTCSSPPLILSSIALAAEAPVPVPASVPLPGEIDADAFVCFGPGFMYTTRAPKGWTLDNESGQPDGLCLVGYPQGGSWKGSTTVIYANATPKSQELGTRSLQEMMESDLKLHKASQRKLRVEDGPAITNHGRKLVTKHFLGDAKEQSFEAVAYADEAGAVVFLVMTSHTEAGFKKALPAFREFVESYRLLASNLVSKPKRAARPATPGAR